MAHRTTLEAERPTKTAKPGKKSPAEKAANSDDLQLIFDAFRRSGYLEAHLDPLSDSVVEHGALESIMAMSHRGRLNVMVHAACKTPHEVVAGFEDVDPRSVLGAGDVKYHVGATGTYVTSTGKEIGIHLVSNPSHLEAVDPVAIGRARAKQTRYGVGSAPKVVPIVMHGDAAFAGQGIWASTTASRTTRSSGAFTPNASACSPCRLSRMCARNTKRSKAKRAKSKKFRTCGSCRITGRPTIAAVSSPNMKRIPEWIVKSWLRSRTPSFACRRAFTFTRKSPSCSSSGPRWDTASAPSITLSRRRVLSVRCCWNAVRFA